MKNFKFSGQTFSFTAGSDISSGDVVVSNDYLGVAIADVANGEEGEAQQTGVVELPKVDGTAFALGEAVYWDAADGEINDDDTNNPLAGYCHKAAASGDAVIQVLLKRGPAAFNGL